MIDKKTMDLLRKMTEEMSKLKPDGTDAIIFLAVSEESGSATSLIKGEEAAVVASLTFLLDYVFEDTPYKVKKRMKRFLINHISQK